MVHTLLYASSVAATGAKYTVITMLQGTQHMIAPNSAFDSITGYAAGEACSRRDLVLDIYDALARQGLKLTLSWTGDGYSEGLGKGKKKKERRKVPKCLKLFVPRSLDGPGR